MDWFVGIDIHNYLTGKSKNTQQWLSHTALADSLGMPRSHHRQDAMKQPNRQCAEVRDCPGSSDKTLRRAEK